ncbi:MAG: tRNA-(ms[2]io[6]A)-hydroxylase [Chromatiales bacterium]
MSRAMRAADPVPREVAGFLRCATPPAWFEAALGDQPTLLLDHANCEKKAASTALGMMFRYELRPDLAAQMSRLAREELRHFEMVEQLLDERGIERRRLSPSRYAGGLHELVRGEEPHRLVDRLVVGAYIEARSCERFARIAPMLDSQLNAFYTGLLNSESRHFMLYLDFARRFCAPGDDIELRIQVIGERESALITSPDPQLRFHSGLPMTSNSL